MVANATLERDWVRRRPRQRAVDLTDTGRHALAELLG
jgi:hypothetical protein